MKRLLAKLLLVLSLVADPVTVLSGDFHYVEMQANHVATQAQGHTLDRHEDAQQPTQKHSPDCEMPCCEDSKCSDQGTCFIQYVLDVVTLKKLRFNLPNSVRDWGTSISLVPDRELPPDNPPPILT